MISFDILFVLLFKSFKTFFSNPVETEPKLSWYLSVI